MSLILIGFLSGIISGMGIGGGTILIPSLVFFVGLEQIQAQGINLIAYIPIGIVAILTHKKSGNIEGKYTKILVFSGVLGAILGAFIGNNIKPQNLQKYFGIFLFIIGLYEFFKKDKKE